MGVVALRDIFFDLTAIGFNIGSIKEDFFFDLIQHMKLKPYQDTCYLDFNGC